MNNKFISCLICVLFFVMISVNLISIEITVSYENKEQPPYYMGDTDEVLDNPGVAVEMVKMLEKEIPELKITLKRTPWKRCIEELTSSNVDGIFNA